MVFAAACRRVFAWSRRPARSVPNQENIAPSKCLNLEIDATSPPVFAGVWIISPLLRDLPQYELLNLPGRRLRQFPEHDVARAFVAGEVLAAPRDQFLRSRGRIRLQLNEGAGRLAPLVVGFRDHGGGLNGGVPVQRLLDLD